MSEGPNCPKVPIAQRSHLPEGPNCSMVQVVNYFWTCVFQYKSIYCKKLKYRINPNNWIRPKSIFFAYLKKITTAGSSHFLSPGLKVSKSRKQMLKFSFEPNKEWKCFCISALALPIKSGQIKKEVYSHHSIKRTGSIKRPGLTFFKKSLLNVPYDRKNEGLNILLYRSYNRVMRVI